MTERSRVADDGTAVRFVRTAVEGVILSEERRLAGRRRMNLPDWRFSLSTGGSLGILHRATTIVALPGVVAIVAPGETTTWRALTPASAWVLEVTPAAVCRATGRPLHVRVPCFAGASSLGRGLGGLVESVTGAATLAEQRDCLGSFLRLVAAEHGGSMNRAACSTVPFHVRRVRALLDAHFTETLHLHDLATHAGRSPLYVLRAFHEAIGMPPHEYQINLRVHRARELLEAERPATEVALSVGFSDLSHLSRHFRRLVGVPPGEFARSVWRERHIA